MGLLLFYAIISIFFSFLCSILEAVLLSVTPTFINIKKQEKITTKMDRKPRKTLILSQFHAKKS